jgi:hypothetical protein
VTELSSYVFLELREGELTRYRGSRGDRDPILLVVPDQEYPARQSVRRLEHEYKLGTALKTAWAARPVALEAHNCTLWATPNADIGATIQFALPTGSGREL